MLLIGTFAGRARSDVPSQVKEQGPMLIGLTMHMQGAHWWARQRWAAAVLLVAASAYVTGAMLSSPPHAREAADHTKVADTRRAHPQEAGVDADAVAGSVRHQVARVPGRPGELVATDPDYRVTFDTRGFSFAPTGSGTPLRMSLQTAERGGRDLGLTAGSWAAASAGAERQVASGLREVVTVRSGEVEWDVVLQTAPVGRGDLVLTSALTGVAHVESDDHGLGLSLVNGGQVAIGELVVKDAASRVLYRTVPTTDGRRLQLLVPDQVLSGARYPVTLDPTVGAEKLVAGTSVPPDESNLAFDGTNFLVVWSDSRSGDSDIYGARVRADGTVLDPNGFVISSATGLQEKPVVAHDGSQYLVAWQDRRSASSLDIYATRVTTSGTVLDSLGVPFSTAPNDQTEPDLAFAGRTALVVWEDARSGTSYDIYGVRWTEVSGVGAGIPISVGTEGGELNPAVTYYGPNFLVVWDDFRSRSTSDIYATRVTTSGRVLDTSGVPVSAGPGHQSYPDVAFDGTNMLLVWTDNRSGNNDIYGARWSPTSGLLDSDGIPIKTASGSQSDPAVAANGSFLVAWTENGPPRTIYGTRVSDNGGVIDPGGFVIGTGADSAVTRGNGGNWATTYDRSTNTYLRTIAPK